MIELEEERKPKYFKDQIPPNFDGLKDKYSDPYFLPSDLSLLSKEFNDSDLSKEQMEFSKKEINPLNIEWRRASEVIDEKQLELFEGKIELPDIKQGEISDCYFLSSLAVLTEFPEIIYQKFLTKETSKAGYYEVQFFIDGEWQIVFIDDYFPVKKGTKNFIFTRPHDNELWACVLEKAWAKANGGYSNIVLGLVPEALLALTGFTSEYLEISKISEQDLWDAVSKSDKVDCLMASGTKNEPFVEGLGLIPGHAYSLVSAQEKKREGDRPLKLLKLYNPWGHQEWNGDWSDHSSLWNEELVKFFSKVSVDDGSFYIDVENFSIFYESLFICNIIWGAALKTFEVNECLSEKQNVFSLVLTESTSVCLSVFFKQYRFNRNLKNSIRPTTLVIARYDEDNDVVFIDGDFSSHPHINYYQMLHAGNYVIWIHTIDHNPQLEPNFSYNFRIASSTNFTSNYLGNDTDYQFLSLLIASYRKRMFSQEKKKQNTWVFQEYNNLKKAGLKIFVGINYSSKIIEVSYTLRKYKLLKVLTSPNQTEEAKITKTLSPGDYIVEIASKNSDLEESFKITPNFK